MMKISKVSNTNLVIQANSQADFDKACNVANVVVELMQDWGYDVAIASDCNVEHWIDICVSGSDSGYGSGLKDWFKDAYKQAKKTA